MNREPIVNLTARERPRVGVGKFGVGPNALPLAYQSDCAYGLASPRWRVISGSCITDGETFLYAGSVAQGHAFCAYINALEAR